MTDVTRLLEAAAAGDRQAATDLLPLVYDELRKLAAARMAREKPGLTIQATALVHEAYLRLVGSDVARHGAAAGTSSPRRRRPCVAFSWKARGGRNASNTAASTLAGFERAQLVADNGGRTIKANAFTGQTTPIGGTGADSLVGGSGSDVLSGGDGNDTLSSNGGRDFLVGGLDVDSLVGGAGDDFLANGTTNYDVFVPPSPR